MGAACGVGWGVADGIAEGVAAGTAGDAGPPAQGVAAGRFMRPASTGVGRGEGVTVIWAVPATGASGSSGVREKEIIARNSYCGDAEEQDYVEALALQKVAHSFQEWFFHAV